MADKSLLVINQLNKILLASADNAQHEKYDMSNIM